MKQHIQTIISHPLISGSSIILAGSFIGNILGYLFNLVMGRLLPVAEYGLLATLTSLLVLFGIFQLSFLGAFARFSAKYKALNDEDAFARLISYGSKVIFLFSGICVVLLLILSPLIASFIKVDNILLLILAILSISVAIIHAYPIGILKGELQFKTITILQLVGPALKIILGILFIYLGFELFGVMMGIFIASSVPVIIGIWLVIRRHKKRPIKNEVIPEFITEFKSYSLKFFVATLGLTVISHADIVLVRSFFEPVVSGQYAALSLMGKAIFYLTSPIYSVFFPLVAQKTERNEEVLKTLLLTIALIAGISLALSFVYFLLPNVVLSIFFPAAEYRVLAPLLGPFSLFIAVFAMVNLFNNYFLSIGKTGVYKINLVFAGFFVVLFYLFHTSLYQVIGVLFATSFLLLVSYLIYYYHLSNGKN